MDSPVPQTLLIPVETLNREFDAKLLLATHACARDWTVIIGGRTRMHNRLGRFPRSIYLSKGLRAGNKTIFSLIQKLGHVIVSLDEEALIRPPDDVYHLMLDAETFNMPRLKFAWGHSNAQTWGSFAGHDGSPILETGNPRLDLLRPELRGYYRRDVERLRDRFGDFVLFSSNFSLVNHYIPKHVRFRVAREVSEAEARAVRDQMVEHKADLFKHFLELIPRLARTLDPIALVVRPHPSESHDAWRDAVAGIGNVHIVHEGPIAPWLMASNALVHNSCTSAVEAALLGKPAFAFRPIVSERHDHFLPNGLSACHSDPGHFVSAVKNAARQPDGGENLTPAQKRLLKQHIASVDGALSSELLLDAIEANRDRLGARPDPVKRIVGFMSHCKRLAVRQIKTRIRTSSSSRRYTAHKFPGISLDDVVKKMAVLREMNPDQPEVDIRVLADSIFEMKPRQASRTRRQQAV